MTVAGIHRVLTLSDIDLSQAINNHAPFEAFRADPNPEELDGLAKIIQKYNAHYFGIHVVHAHNLLNEGEAMVTAKTPPQQGLLAPIYQKRPISAIELLSGNHYPRVITAREGLIGEGKAANLHPSEYQTGNLPECFTTVSENFYAEALEYMSEHPHVALILLDLEYCDEILELDDAYGGTSTFRRSDLPDISTRIATWRVDVRSGYSSLKGHEFHSYTKDGKHIKYVDGKITQWQDIS